MPHALTKAFGSPFEAILLLILLSLLLLFLFLFLIHCLNRGNGLGVPGTAAGRRRIGQPGGR